jgi:hypothetical protein
MYTVITDLQEINATIKIFRAKLKNFAHKENESTWIFPNGDKIEIPSYQITTESGLLEVGLPNQWNNRVPHLFRFFNDTAWPKSPEVEINIADVQGGNASGVFVKSEEDIFICSRGDFTAFRGRIPRETSFLYFPNKIIECNEKSRHTNLINITNIKSPRFIENFAFFIKQIAKLKSDFKNHKTQNPATIELDESDANWSFSDEFEGQKTIASNLGDELSYDYTHGPLCNFLKEKLSEVLNKQSNNTHQVLKNKHIDVAIVSNESQKADIIFEVKTSHLYNPQIYSGIGQLLVYKQKFGTPSTKLVIVIPAPPNGDIISAYSTGKILHQLGISLIIHTDNEFHTINNVSLCDFTSAAITEMA